MPGVGGAGGGAGEGGAGGGGGRGGRGGGGRGAGGAGGAGPPPGGRSAQEAAAAEAQACARLEALEASLARAAELRARTGGALAALRARATEMRQGLEPVRACTQALSRAHGNIDAALRVTERSLEHYDAARTLGPAAEAGPGVGSERLGVFEEAVRGLQAAADFLGHNRGMKSADKALAATEALLGKARIKGVASFTDLLSTANQLPEAVLASAEPPSSLARAALPEEETALLTRLACLLGPDGGGQCVVAYASSRAAAIQGSLRTLGAGTLTTGDEVARLPRDALETYIETWTSLLASGARLASVEKALVESVFPLEAQPRAFRGAVEQGLVSILEQGLGIARSKKTPEKVFMLLKMLDALRTVGEEMRAILTSMQCAQLEGKLNELVRILKAASRSSFAELGAAIDRDCSRPPSPDGTVHPVSAYIVHYFRRLLKNANASGVLFADPASGLDEEGRRGAAGASSSWESTVSSDMLTVPQSEQNKFFREASAMRDADSAMAHAGGCIVELLKGGLEQVARGVKQPALAQLFLLNNYRYLETSLNSQQLAGTLGEKWDATLVPQQVSRFYEAGWGRLRDALEKRGEPKEALRAVNGEVEGIARLHRSWVIPDRDLRKVIQGKVLADILPAYELFIEAQSSHPKMAKLGSNPGKLLKLDAGRFETLVASELYDGEGGAPGARPPAFLGLPGGLSKMVAQCSAHPPC